MVGRTISHYKILSKLGRGSIGEIWKADARDLKRIVALGTNEEKWDSLDYQAGRPCLGAKGDGARFHARCRYAAAKH